MAILPLTTKPCAFDGLDPSVIPLEIASIGQEVSQWHEPLSVKGNHALQYGYNTHAQTDAHKLFQGRSKQVCRRFSDDNSARVHRNEIAVKARSYRATPVNVTEPR